MGTDLLPVAFVLLLTWWVHSTLLLGTAGAISLGRREMSPRSREWLWKSAVVLPFLTVPVQYALGTALLWRWEVPFVQDALTVPPSESVPTTTKNVLPSVPSVAESKPISPRPAHELRSGSKPPAIAEKPTRFPIIIETVVSDASSLQSSGHFNQPIPIEEPSPVVTLPRPAEIEISKPAAIVPEATVRSPQDMSNQNARWPWFVPSIVGVVLLLGMIGATRFLWLLICTSRLIRRSRRLTSGMAYEELQRLLSQSQMRGTIHLSESAECSIPAAGGLFRRVILLPLAIQDRLGREELRALLAHEQGHHARGDVWWLWLGRGLCHLVPVQPLYFWAVREWHWAAEPLCDDWAIARNVSPIALAKSLTQIAEWHIAKPAIGPAATNGPSQLTYRVERLLNRSDITPLWKRRLLPLLVPLWAGLALAFAPLVSWSEGNQRSIHSETHQHSNVPSTWHDETNTVENAPSNATVSQIPKDILENLESIQSDLDRVLSLLETMEEDPEIRALARQLQRRHKAILSKQGLRSDPSDKTAFTLEADQATVRFDPKSSQVEIHLLRGSRNWPGRRRIWFEKEHLTIPVSNFESLGKTSFTLQAGQATVRFDPKLSQIEIHLRRGSIDSPGRRRVWFEEERWTVPVSDFDPNVIHRPSLERASSP